MQDTAAAPVRTKAVYTSYRYAIYNFFFTSSQSQLYENDRAHKKNASPVLSRPIPSHPSIPSSHASIQSSIIQRTTASPKPQCTSTYISRRNTEVLQPTRRSSSRGRAIHNRAISHRMVNRRHCARSRGVVHMRTITHLVVASRHGSCCRAVVHVRTIVHGVVPSRHRCAVHVPPVGHPVVSARHRACGRGVVHVRACISPR